MVSQNAELTKMVQKMKRADERWAGGEERRHQEGRRGLMGEVHVKLAVIISCYNTCSGLMSLLALPLIAGLSGSSRAKATPSPCPAGLPPPHWTSSPSTCR